MVRLDEQRNNEFTLLNLTNIASGTTAYAYVNMDDMKFLGLQLIIGGTDTVTVTLEATIQSDGTAAASCTYHDVTSALFGVASITVTSLWIINEPDAYKYIRVKYVTSGGTGDGDLTIYGKRSY